MVLGRFRPGSEGRPIWYFMLALSTAVDLAVKSPKAVGWPCYFTAPVGSAVCLDSPQGETRDGPKVDNAVWCQHVCSNLHPRKRNNTHCRSSHSVLAIGLSRPNSCPMADWPGRCCRLGCFCGLPPLPTSLPFKAFLMGMLGGVGAAALAVVATR